MNRRTVLSRLGPAVALLAGCASTERSGSSPTATTSPTSTGTTPPESTTTTPRTSTPSLPSRVSLADFRFDVAVLDQFTSHHPARLRVRVTNASNLPILLVGGPTPVFSSYFGRHEDGDARLAIVPDGLADQEYPGNASSGEDPVDYVPSDPVDGCWRWPYADFDLTWNASLAYRELSPGDATETTYWVLDYRNDACFPAGSYRFADDVWLRHGTWEHRNHEESKTPVSLAFSLDVDESGRLAASVDDPRITMGST